MLSWSFVSDQTQKQYKLLTEGSDSAARTYEGFSFVCCGVLVVLWVVVCGLFFFAFLLLRFRFCTCSNSAPNLGVKGILLLLERSFPKPHFLAPGV